MKFSSEQVSNNFTPAQWAGRTPAYASGGPLHFPAEAPKTLTEALLRHAEQEDKGVIYIQKDGQEDFQSYAALLREARQLLAGLRAYGLQPGARVILQIDNLRRHFTAFWACVLGGFTPVTVAVAPSYKEVNGVVNKLFNTWKLLQGPLVITSAHLEKDVAGISKFLPMEGLKTVAVEDLFGGSQEEPIFCSKPEDLVFFQLTSGSTGIPKCIQETHRGIIAHIHGAQQFNGYGPSDVTFNWLPVDHVVPILTSHLKDVYLGCGQIHAKSDIILAEPLRWLDVLEKHRVTHTWCPNFGFKLVSDRLDEAKKRHWDLSSLKFLMNAGEQVTLPVVSDFLRKTAPFGVRKEAMQPAFGMAEVCTCMTYQNNFDPESGVHRFRKSSLGGLLEPAETDDPAAITFVDLGPPVPGVEIRITDKENRVVPEGVIGRFQIRGAVVTPGYLYNDAANADAFVGDGWFNSGDLGFILNGHLTLTGREKEIIIIRGANFYCYEIEDVVNSIEGVEPTHVSSSAVEDPKTGTEALAVFFVPKADYGFGEEGNLSPKLPALIRQIRSKVAASLGMNPAVVVPLEKKQFLKTTSGKIQRSQMKKNFEAGEYQSILQRLENLAGSEGTTAAQDELEEKLVRIWKELLPVKQVGTTENFFELGGDSLLAARVISRVQDAFDVQLPLQVLFNGGGTIAGMAGHIRSGGSNSLKVPPVQPRKEAGPAPLSAQQQRLWLVDQINPGCPAYQVASVVRLDGPVHLDALRKALDALVQRHHALRTRFNIVDGKLTQSLAESTTMPLELRAVREPKSALREALRAEARQPFDLTAGSLARATLFELSESEHYLLLVVHQIATDGWSMSILFRELHQLYAHHAHGTPLDLPPVQVQPADFALWQRAWQTPEVIEQQMEYWRNELRAPLPELDLPNDRPRPNVQTFASEVERHPLPPDVAQLVRSAARQHGSTVFMVLLGAWEALLSRITAQEDIIVGSATSARNRPELEQTVGFFANTVALRANLSSNPSFSTLLRQTRDRILGAFANQHAPFENLVEELHPHRSPNRPPIIQAWFGSWEPLPSFQAGPTRIQVEELFSAGAQFELSLFVIDGPEEISIVWEHNPDLFSPYTIAALRRQYLELLRLLTSNPQAPLQSIFAQLGEAELQWRLQQQAAPRSTLRSSRRKAVHVAP